MEYTRNNDNLYQEGTIISAKEDPGLKLLIRSYRQHIYFCSIIDEPSAKYLAYFEEELVAPV